MESNEGHTELWLYPTGFVTARRDGGGATSTKPRRLTAGDKDSDPKWSPDGRWIAFAAKRKDDDEPQVYLIAPDGGEAKRLTNLAGGCASLKWFADGTRIAFVSWVWPALATNALQAKRKKEIKDAKVKAHVTERSEFRFWDHWLTDRTCATRVHLRRCNGPLSRRAFWTGIALPPWEPSIDDFRHRARRPRARVDRRSRTRAADDESDRHRDRRSRVKEKAGADEQDE
jgi:Tol biopolymer transport system component